MKTEICTSISQSRRLLACNVDPSTADMVWLNRGAKVEPYLSLNQGCNRAIPEVGDVSAWSLSALISLLPREIEKVEDYAENKEYSLMIYPYLQGWQIEYQYCEYEIYHDLTTVCDTDLIEACVRMICWLVANGYKLNRIEK